MKKQMSLITVISLLVMMSFSFAYAGHGDAKGKEQPPMKMAGKDVFADGLQLTFMAHTNQQHKMMLKKMKMNETIEPGTTHHVMVLIRDEKTGSELANLPVTIKMIDADDNEQTKTGGYKEMMKTYEAYFNMPKKGRYLIKVLFEKEGQEHYIGLSYDLI